MKIRAAGRGEDKKAHLDEKKIEKMPLPPSLT
jgi:hypothetical protein